MNLSAKIAAIEFDGDEVRLAVVRTGRRLPTVLELRTATATYSNPETRVDALADTLSDLLKELKAVPNVYVLCASSQYAVARKIAVPFRGRRRVAAAIPFEVEPHLAFPVEDLVVDHALIREVEGESEVLAVGMRRDSLAELLAVLERARVDVEGVGVDVAGLTALWQAGRPGQTRLHAVLHVRGTGSILAVVNDKALAFFRHLPYTAADFQESVGEGPVREMRNSLRSFLATWRGEDEIQDLTITGAQLSDAEAARIEEAVGVPVHRVDLLEALEASGLLPPNGLDEPSAGWGGVEPAAMASPPGHVWGAAIGVALGAAGASPAFDFRKGELSPPNPLQGIIRHAAFSSCLALLVLIGYGVYCYLDFRSNVARIEQVGQETWDLFAEAFTDAAYVKANQPPRTMGGISELYGALALEIEETAGRGDAFPTEMFSRATLLDILEALSETLPGDTVTIINLKITPARSAGSPRIDIKGEVKDPEAFNEAFAKLKQSPVLQIEEEPTRRNEAGKTTFTIAATLREGARAED